MSAAQYAPQGVPAAAEAAAGPWDRQAALALPHYGLAADSELTLLSLSENATYRVRDPRSGALAILRLSRPGSRSPDELRSELAWITALRCEGVAATPAVIPTVDGAPLCRFTDGTGQVQHATLFEYIRGEALDDTALRPVFRQMGEITARLHRHDRGWVRPAGFTRPTWDVDACMGREGRWGFWREHPQIGPQEAALLGAVDDKVRRDLAAYGRPAGRFGLVHGDMRVANVLVDAAGGLNVIDFDDCAFSWHLYDLAGSLAFIEAHPQVDALTAAWLEGYSTRVSLDAADRAAAPAIVMMRRLLLIGWFTTHGHAPEARDIGTTYVADSLGIAEAYLGDRYLAPALAPRRAA